MKKVEDYNYQASSIYNHGAALKRTIEDPNSFLFILFICFCFSKNWIYPQTTNSHVTRIMSSWNSRI